MGGMMMKTKIMKLCIGLSLVILMVGTVALQNAFSIALPGKPALSQAGLFDAEQYRGKVVYLDFWASWCGPCKKSFPWMEAMHKKYERMGLKVIAVNLDKKKALADKFLKKIPANFPILFDPAGVLANQYQLAGMPMTYIIDRNGVIRYRHIGYVPAMQGHYERQIVDLLKK